MENHAGPTVNHDPGDLAAPFPTAAAGRRRAGGFRGQFIHQRLDQSGRIRGGYHDVITTVMARIPFCGAPVAAGGAFALVAAVRALYHHGAADDRNRLRDFYSLLSPGLTWTNAAGGRLYYRRRGSGVDDSRGMERR